MAHIFKATRVAVIRYTQDSPTPHTCGVDFIDTSQTPPVPGSMQLQVANDDVEDPQALRDAIDARATSLYGNDFNWDV